MSTQELIFTLGELEITIGDGGFPIRAVVGDRDYLQPQHEPGLLRLGGVPQRWEFAGLITDRDESEARYAVVDHPELEYTVRNSFAGSWLQRQMLLNTSSSTMAIDDLMLSLRPADGQVGWTLTAAGETGWAIQPADGNGPVLTGELTQGSATRSGEDGFSTGELLLRPGHRLVLQWRIELASNPSRAATGRRQAGLSPQTVLPCGEPYEITDPDMAVVVSDPVKLYPEDDVQVVVSDRPGRYPVELRSARGTTRIDLAWVPSTEDLIIDLSNRWLTEHRSGAGVGVLPGGGAALGLQQAVVARWCGVEVEAEDALGLHSARLLVADRLSMMDQAFLAQETVRTGDPDPLARARQAMLELTEPQPGLGLAATRICLAELATGGSPAEVLARLRELAETVRRSDHPAGAGEDHLRIAGTELEVITVTSPAAGSATAELLDHARAIGAELGAGLPGRRMTELSPSTVIYAAAVLDLLPDSLGPALTESWGIPPHWLAERTRSVAVASALWPEESDDSSASNPAEVSDAIGWLVLGRPIE